MFFSLSVSSQTLKGIVVDVETGSPLFPVTIVNHVNELSVSTDEQGYFSIPATKGDIISWSFIGYRTVQLGATPGVDQKIFLSPLSVKLPEYVLHEYTQFQKDSIEMTARYSSALNTKPIKPSFSSANGGGISGLIGGPIQKLSKSYKQNKRFKENFKKDMEQKYIDTKYTQALVAALSGFSGDTLITFMNSYPMEYSFARAATDLEIKMWIRNNYKDYQHKGTQKALQKTK